MLGEKLLNIVRIPLNPAMIIVLGTYTAIWGLWVSNPWSNTFDYPPYHALETVAPRYVWTFFAMACAISIVYGALRGRYKSVITGAWIGFMHWFVVGFILLIGDWTDPAGITTLLIASYCAVIFINVKHNANHFER